jgi:hypothetical protein
MSYIPNISNYAAKLVGVLAYMVQYGCITHCVLEYVGDFVIVNTFMFSICFTCVYLSVQERFKI